MRILTIEDDPLISQRISAACIDEGFVCHCAETGTDGLEMLRYYDYDAVILDLVLPDISGVEILERTRAIKNSTPILVLSGISGTDDKVKCLSQGADDYLTKPFSRIELMARIYAIVRRANGYYSSIVSTGPLEIDIRQRLVRINGQDLNLTSKEYSILELLALKKGCVLSKETFLNHIYGGMDEPEVKIVDVFICKLRRKIAELAGGINFIETIWGRGYTLKIFPDVETTEPERIKEVI